MSLNTGFFAAYNQRHKRTTVAYRLPLNNQQHQHTSYLKSARSSSVESNNGKESFLPSIISSNGSQDGHRPYRRNDFANNHVFVAKQKLARFFLAQPTVNIQSKSELMHLFDQQKPKQKNRRININKRQENNSETKSIRSSNHDTHLSVVNLTMKTPLATSRTRDPFAAISHRRVEIIKAPRPSIDWINPVINQQFQFTSKPYMEDNLEPDTIINELMDNNSDIVNSTIHPLDLSVSYVKSMIPSGRAAHR